MFGEWKVQIISNPGMMAKRVFMFQRDRSGVAFLCKDGSYRRFTEGEKFDDSEVYFAELDDIQLQALADAFAEKGLRTANDARHEGMLKATQSHLEDMRAIVFKRKPGDAVPSNNRN